MTFNPEGTAVEALKCCLAWEPDARILGNVRAVELAAILVDLINTCPKCGSTAWVNIDCDLCGVCHRLGRDGPPEAATRPSSTPQETK